MRYVIIGSGITGYSAAIAIRTIDQKGSIDLFTESQVLPYYRPRLIEVLAGKIDFNQILIKPATFYKENNIFLHTETITKISKSTQEVVSKNGKVYHYDKLLLATGATPFIPPIDGADKENVFTFRSQTDAKKIRAMATNKKVIVIGGGLLGLETAYSLKSLGAKVTVVEFFDRLLPRQLDQGGADFLKKKLEADDIDFRLGTGTKAILGENSVSGIQLDSGEILPADVVIVSAGVRPRTQLALEAEISLNKGIIVNNQLETSVANIYAAGDVAEYNNLLYGLWLPAKDQGTIAGKCMAGENTQYTGSLLESRLKVANISLFSFGPVENKDSEEKIVSENESYTRLLIKNNELTGAICIGDQKKSILITKVTSGKLSLQDSGLV
jgi:nitrite reductase (NADH) large subunit